jgi:hypothetical protein
MYANMAVPETGIRIEKIIAGIPNTEAAAGEIKADSILSNVPPPLFASASIQPYFRLCFQTKKACISRLRASGNIFSHVSGVRVNT